MRSDRPSEVMSQKMSQRGPFRAEASPALCESCSSNTTQRACRKNGTNYSLLCRQCVFWVKSRLATKQAERAERNLCCPNPLFIFQTMLQIGGSLSPPLATHPTPHPPFSPRSCEALDISNNLDVVINSKSVDEISGHARGVSGDKAVQ